MKCPLSYELKIACIIYHFNRKNEGAWFTRIINEYIRVESILDPTWFGNFPDEYKMKRGKRSVSEALDVLSDWMIIKGYYGETEKGHAGRLYEIDLDYGGHIIPELHEKYWRVTGDV